MATMGNMKQELNKFNHKKKSVVFSSLQAIAMAVTKRGRKASRVQPRLKMLKPITKLVLLSFTVAL